jgi:hypothetical protein
LVVDGEIVDLNGISRPAGPPIIDEKFAHSQNKAAQPQHWLTRNSNPMSLAATRVAQASGEH